MYADTISFFTKNITLPLESIEGNFGSSQGSAVAVSSIYLMGLHIAAFACLIELKM